MYSSLHNKNAALILATWLTWHWLCFLALCIIAAVFRAVLDLRFFSKYLLLLVEVLAYPKLCKIDVYALFMLQSVFCIIHFFSLFEHKGNPHYSLMSTKSIWHPPLPSESTHHQVVSSWQLYQSLLSRMYGRRSGDRTANMIIGPYPSGVLLPSALMDILVFQHDLCLNMVFATDTL